MAAKATAIFDADDSRLQQAIARIDRSLLAIQAKFAKIGASIGVALGGAAVAAGVFGAGIKSALDEAGRLNDLSQNTGVAVADLAVLTQEFKNAGKGGEDVGKVFAKMQRTLADGSANDVIRALGIDLEALGEMTPLDQFHALGTAIAGLKSPTDRTAAATKLFGKEGATLLSMFSSKGFGEAAAQVGEQARILGQDAAFLDDAGDKLALAGTKTQGFFVGVADRVVPVLRPLLDRFAALDLSKKGQETGDIIATMVQAIEDGDIGAVLLDTMKFSMASAVNFLLEGLLSVIGIFGAVFLDKMNEIHEAMMHGFLAAVAVFDRIPGVKGYITGRREELARETAANDRDSDRSRGIGKYGHLFDTEAMHRDLEATIGRSFSASRTARERALAEVPTVAPLGGVAEGFGGSAAVSALGRVGGAFGAGGAGDPLIEANRQRETGNNYLRGILDALTGDQAGEPRTATGFYG